MEKHYAILRIASRCSRTAIGQANAHGNRSDISAHVDRSRSHLNQFWVPNLGLENPTDLIGAVDRVTEVLGARRRSDNAGLLAEFHVGASPEFFLHDDGREGIDPSKIQLWFDHNIEVFNRRFPGQVAQARLDMDEKTPHAAIFLIPTYVKTTKRGSALWVSYRQQFGGNKHEASEKCTALQDWYAEEMSCFGLHRGEPKEVTGAVHVHHNTYRQIEAKKSVATELAKQKAEVEAASSHRAAVAASLLVLQLKCELDALNVSKALLEKKLLKLQSDQEALNQQKIANDTAIKRMVSGFAKAANLIADRQIMRAAQPGAEIKFVLKHHDRDSKILAPVWSMVRPIINSLLALVEGLERDREAAQTERDKLAAERERVRIDNERMAYEFAALKAKTQSQLKAINEAASDLIALRDQMTPEQIEQLNAVISDNQPTPA